MTAIPAHPTARGDRTLTGSLLCLALLLTACGSSRDGRHGEARPDSAFAAMQERGKEAMGVDQYTSSHVFEELPNGGRIVLQRDAPDSAGTLAIREHLAAIAAAFSAGQFDVPGFVHSQVVPGTAVMAARRDRISYGMDTLPRGGEVTIRTDDPAAVAAVHEFLAFQRGAHHAAGHGSESEGMARP